MTSVPQEQAEGLPEQRAESEVGMRLREAREARKLSRADVARQLHLEPKLIEALEEGDTANLPPPIFVRGYLRSYARLLGLPEKECVAGYEPEDAEPALLPNIDLKPQASSRDVPVRLVTYTLAVGLISLALLWWFGKGGESSRELLGFGHKPDSAIATPASAPSSALAETAAAAVAEPPATAAAAEPASTAIDQAQSATPGPLAQAEKPAATTDPAAEAAHRLAAAGMDSAAATASAGAAGHNTSPQADGKEHQLVLHYSQPSWTEIRDANGRELVYQLVEAGTTLKLGGPAPFSVLLGYSPGVHIEYNGQPFDQTRYTHNNVARFVIGKAQSHESAPAASATTQGG